MQVQHDDGVTPPLGITHRIGLWQAAQKPVRLGGGFRQVRGGNAEGDALRVRGVFIHLDVEVMSPQAINAKTLSAHQTMRPAAAHNGAPHAAGSQGASGKRAGQSVLHNANIDAQYTLGRAVTTVTHCDPLAVVPERVVAHLAVRV